MKDWQTLLGDEWEDVDANYGPQTQVVVSALEVLGETAWFQRVGAPKLGNIAAVLTWEAALAPLQTRNDPRYGPNGHLLAPSLACIEIIEASAYRPLWQRAREDAFDYCSVSPYLPQALPEVARDFLDEYVYEFVSFLLAEILGAVQLETTYFREMLAWFHAGYFPCGWEGAWPEGQRRVY